MTSSRPVITKVSSLNNLSRPEAVQHKCPSQSEWLSLLHIIVRLIKTSSHNYYYIKNYHLQQFPKLISSHRFIEWMPSGLIPLSVYLKSRRGQITGISYIDSCPIAVCKNIRIPRNKVFKGLASRGKSSLGWFFGFKLHLIVNQVGELLAFKVTTGNVNDRTPVKDWCQGLTGKLLAGKGYLGKNFLNSYLKMD